MKNQYVVGITGYAQSGKTTVADFLVQEQGFVHINFADTLREMASAINPMIYYFGEEGWGEEYYYNDALKDYGYEKAKKEFPEFRRFLQRLGTEGGRRVLGDSLWVDKWEEKAKAALQAGKSVVASDVRFHNEANKIMNLRFFQTHGGGVPVPTKEIWRVTRPGVGPLSEHSSEKEMESIEVNRTIENDRDKEYLGSIAEACYHCMVQEEEALRDEVVTFMKTLHVRKGN
jgi:hypothetical protein